MIGGIAGNAHQGRRGWDLLDGVVVDGLVGGATAGVGRAAAPFISRAVGPAIGRVAQPIASGFRNSRFGQYVGRSVVANSFNRFNVFARNGGFWGKPSVLQGTNATGQVTSRGSFRVGTTRAAWDSAPVGPRGGSSLPDLWGRSGQTPLHGNPAAANRLGSQSLPVVDQPPVPPERHQSRSTG